MDLPLSLRKQGVGRPPIRKANEMVKKNEKKLSSTGQSSIIEEYEPSYKRSRFLCLPTFVYFLFKAKNNYYL